MSEFTLVDTGNALQDFLADIPAGGTIALDTEFMRERTYYAQLCLVQLAVGERIVCIDPLALDDLGALWRRLADRDTLILLHAGRQDLEVIFQASGTIPAPVFDTQLAAALCGYGDQVGYANLVKDVLGITLDKSMTRADWSRRPLSQDALDYAADDVRHLHALYEHLAARLRELGRESWLKPEHEALTDVAQYEPDPAHAWRRIRAAAKLKAREIAVLAALAEWREREAIRSNRPRKWLLKDDVLVFMAQRPPRTLAELIAVRGIEEGFASRHGETLLGLIDNARQSAPPPDLPKMRDRLTPTQEAQADLLMAALKAIAARNKLAAASIANRKEIERLVRGDRDIDLMRGWRRAAAGEMLLEVLEGRLALVTEPEGIRFVTSDK